MKKTKSLLALLMVLALCLGIFAGCGTTTSNNNDDDDTGTTQGNLTEDDDETLTDAPEDIIGKVTYVGTSYLSVSTYESESKITDYAALDTSTLTDAGATEYVYPEDSATYYTVSGGTLVSATADDVVTGCMIAVTAADDGTQQIIILKTADEDSNDTTDETDTDEETETVAEVTAINDDGTLELSIYEVLDSTVEIADYADVDLTNYYDSYTTETYTIADDSVISVVEEGVLTETTSDEIVAGDTLVVYTDDSDITNIVIYHAEEDSTT